MKRIGIGRFGERGDDGLEAFLEVAAEPRARRAARRCRARRLPRPAAARARRRRAGACASPSASAVLPTPASPTNTGLFFRRRQRISIVRCSSSVAADQRIELAGPRARGQVHARRRSADRATSPARARRCPASASSGSSPAVGAAVVDGGTLLMPCVMYSRTSSRVTPCARAAAPHTTCSAAASRRARRPTGLPAARRSARGAQRSAARGGTPASAPAPSAARARTARRIRSRYLSRSGGAAAGRRRRPRGSARRRDRARARRAGARASGACAAATSPRGTRRSERFRARD